MSGGERGKWQEACSQLSNHNNVQQNFDMFKKRRQLIIVWSEIITDSVNVSISRITRRMQMSLFFNVFTGPWRQPNWVTGAITQEISYDWSNRTRSDTRFAKCSKNHKINCRSGSLTKSKLKAMVFVIGHLLFQWWCMAIWYQHWKFNMSNWSCRVCIWTSFFPMVV